MRPNFIQKAFSGIIASSFLFTITAVSQVNVEKPNTIDYTQYVSPFIGSAGHGHVFVGANVPYGAVQLGPTTIFEGWDWCSGYNYASDTILGFTHTHLSGTGIGDLNDILLLPATGPLFLKKATKGNMQSGYGSAFSHQNEICQPGYYSVLFDRYKVKAELTATERVGFHKYSFSSVDNAHVLLDLADGLGWDQPVETLVKLINDSTLVGYRFSKGWANDQRVFFAAKLSQPLTKFETYDSVSLQKGNVAKGLRIKVAMYFNASKNKPLLIKVGISPVSYENALKNIEAEIPHWNFAKTRQEAAAKWNAELGKVQIKADPQTMKVFYTATYHTMFAPSLFNDHNGDYRGTDKQVYKNANFTNYTTFSLWDTYRAFHPLYTILHPDRVPDIVKSMMAIYEQQGKLPVWHLMGNETNTMIGYHSVPVIVDAYLKGFKGFDAEKAYAALKQSAMQHKDGIEYIQKLQYIPADKLNESVAKGLEYAIDDWCIAQMAKRLNKQEDYQYFSKRAKLYQQYFDKNVGFMRGKLSDGSWRTPFDPVASKHREDDYCEGNAWQYTWLVPQDVEGLIKLFGGDTPFCNKLDELFTTSLKLSSESSPDISGLIGMYAHGNEPNHHIPYLFSYAGKPWVTAEKIRQITNDFYTDKPDGLCGNEDLGQMSAWYVFSALGFYPVNPANSNYVFGSPLINEATLQLPKGKQFHVRVVNNSSTNKYIQKIMLNGKPYTKSYLSHASLVSGGELLIYMGNQASTTWGVSAADRPKSE